jgi:hypothetical protein
MKKALVLNLSKDVDGLPIVPGAVDVSEETPGNYIAYGAPVPNSSGKGSRRGAEQVYAYLTEHKSGEYVVVADDLDFLEIDPLDKGNKPQDVRPFYRFYVLKGTRPNPKGGDDISFTRQQHTFKAGQIPLLPPSAQVPWLVDDMTITEMKLSLPSVFSDEQRRAVEDGV